MGEFLIQLEKLEPIHVGLVALIVLILYFANKIRVTYSIKKQLEQIRNNWGKPCQNKKFSESTLLYYSLKEKSKDDNSYHIDDATWHDLNLDEVYSILNRTTTEIGSQYMYNLLRNPVMSREELQKREKLIGSFGENKNLREDTQLCLTFLSSTDGAYIPYLLWGALPEKSLFRYVVPVLHYVSISILLLTVFQYLHFSAILIMFSVNVLVRYFLKRKIDMYIYSFKDLVKLLYTAKKISKLKFPELKNLQEQLKENLKKTNSILKKIFIFQFKYPIGFIDYVNSYFLFDIKSYYTVLAKIEKNKNHLREIYELIGYIDSMISIASFRTEYSKHCQPMFNAHDKFVENIYNPLIKEPVLNSFIFENNSTIVTGSNMSGKTTFLKTIGVNSILAQTIHTCLADKYQMPFIKTTSSLNIADNLLEGKSYYLSEIESILRIIKASESDTLHLFLLDEIFRGTNSTERHAISIEVYKYLANNKDIVLATTHDLQICNHLEDIYNNVHFREQIIDSSLVFDYKIHEGISTSRNAIELLRQVGYPDKLIDNARNLVDVVETK